MRSNPRLLPAWALTITAMSLAAGGLLSTTRLSTVMAESKNDSIGQYRAEICRILHHSEKVQLGAYYFQPTEQDTQGRLAGALLDEGTYVCDLYGNSVRIERGGYALYLIRVADVSGINKTLQKRLQDPASPDSVERSQIRRAKNMGLHRPQPSQKAQEPAFFNLK
jgi:hypothetical protein